MSARTPQPPLPLRHDASAPADMRAVLASAKASHPLPDAVRARSEEKLDRLMIVPAAAGLVLWMKGLAVAACLGAGVVTVTQVLPAVRRNPRSASPVSPVNVRRVVADIPPPASPSAPSAAHAATPAAPAPFLPARPHESPEPAGERVPSPDDSLAREVAMLERARALLETSPAEALAALDVHAATFPAGRLAMERELLAVDALSRAGRVADARRRGEVLLASAHGSIYEERVKTMLGGLRASGESGRGGR
jgi:hypothetical protein